MPSPLRPRSQGIRIPPMGIPSATTMLVVRKELIVVCQGINICPPRPCWLSAKHLQLVLEVLTWCPQRPYWLFAKISLVVQFAWARHDFLLNFENEKMIPWGGPKIWLQSKQVIALFIFQRRENLLEVYYKFPKLASLRMIGDRNCNEALLEQYYNSTGWYYYYIVSWNSSIRVLWWY